MEIAVDEAAVLPCRYHTFCVNSNATRMPNYFTYLWGEKDSLVRVLRNIYLYYNNQYHMLSSLVFGRHSCDSSRFTTYRPFCDIIRPLIWCNRGWSFTEPYQKNIMMVNQRYTNALALFRLLTRHTLDPVHIQNQIFDLLGLPPSSTSSTWRATPVKHIVKFLFANTISPGLNK